MPTISIQVLGNLSLNTSFVLYLISYIPQLCHNKKITHIEQLSLGFHLLLFLSYSFDLIYGFASHLPWQYKTVSTVGLFLLCIQHIQLSQFYLKRGLLVTLTFTSLLFILNCFTIYYFFIILDCKLAAKSTLLLGTLSRICGLVYYYPQIIKNNNLKSAKALSLKYIYLNFILALLDTLSAWCLNWGWPNKLSAPIAAILMLVILYQEKKFKEGASLLINNVKEVQI